MAILVKKSHPPFIGKNGGWQVLWGKMGIVCLEEEIAVVNHIGLEIQLVHEPTGSLHGLLA